MTIDIGILGIIITVVLGVASLLIYSKKNTVNLKITNKKGNQEMHDVTIANEINNKNVEK